MWSVGVAGIAWGPSPCARMYRTTHSGVPENAFRCPGRAFRRPGECIPVSRTSAPVSRTSAVMQRRRDPSHGGVVRRLQSRTTHEQRARCHGLRAGINGDVRGGTFATVCERETLAPAAAEERERVAFERGGEAAERALRVEVTHRTAQRRDGGGRRGPGQCVDRSREGALRGASPCRAPRTGAHAITPPTRMTTARNPSPPPPSRRASRSSGSAGQRPVRFPQQPGGDLREPRRRIARPTRDVPVACRVPGGHPGLVRAVAPESPPTLHCAMCPFRAGVPVGHPWAGACGRVGVASDAASRDVSVPLRGSPTLHRAMCPFRAGVPGGHPGLVRAVASESPPTLHCAMGPFRAGGPMGWCVRSRRSRLRRCIARWVPCVPGFPLVTPGLCVRSRRSRLRRCIARRPPRDASFTSHRASPTSRCALHVASRGAPSSRQGDGARGSGGWVHRTHREHLAFAKRSPRATRARSARGSAARCTRCSRDLRTAPQDPRGVSADQK